MRRTPALVSSLALLTVVTASLVGCSSAAASCEPAIAAGDASALVTADGDFGDAPEVDAPSPLTVDEAERSVLETGEGRVAGPGDVVDFEATVIDGESGTVLLQTQYDPEVQPVRGTAGDEGSLYASFTCAQAGDRIALVTPMGVSGIDTSSVGQSDTDATIIFVIDVVATYPGKADGANQLPLDGMPSVVTAPDGTPGITVPDGGPPAETRISTIKAGSGETVADGDLVVVNLSYWVWPVDGSEIRQLYSSWDGSARTLPVIEDATGQTGITPGVYDAIEGSQLGSQLLAVVAPADSYADGAWPSGASAGDTLIYVIDVLGIQSTADEE